LACPRFFSPSGFLNSKTGTSDKESFGRETKIKGKENRVSACVSDIMDLLDLLAPPSLAEDWDNVGLQIGDPAHNVKRIWVALDPTYAVVDAACQHQVDLLITHHPLIFKPLQSLDISTPQGAVIDLALRHQMAIFTAHTNLDSATGGINDILGGHIGLSNLSPLMASDHETGIGRIGLLDTELTLNTLVSVVKVKLNLPYLKVVGNPDMAVDTVAVCSGSGSSLLGDFLVSGAQVFISGDLRYHDAREIEAFDRGLIDIGHFASEYLFVEDLVERLKTLFVERDLNIEAQACRIERDPFRIYQ
jgi:dinuclear metal center YbgI/SA1388 family protein